MNFFLLISVKVGVLGKFQGTFFFFPSPLPPQSTDYCCCKQTVVAYYDDPFYALLLFLLIILLFLQLSSTFLFSSEACFSFLCYATSHMGKDKLHIMLSYTICGQQ